MKREEIFTSLYTNDTVYRPPMEKESAFLEVATGCSWGRCHFCDFVRDAFTVIPLEIVEEKAKLLNSVIGGNPRLFLLGQNALTLSAKHLAGIFEIIDRCLPSVREVSMYARVDDINSKSLPQLQALRTLGLKRLHVGVESGSDAVLKLCNKGVRSAEMIAAFARLDQAGIEYCVTSILGLGGQDLWQEHALATAHLYNQIQPQSIWVLALQLWPGTVLAEQVKNGQFQPPSPREMLIEERLLLENIRTCWCQYMDTTALGKYTIIGVLPEGKASLLGAIDQLLGQEDGSTV